MRGNSGRKRVGGNMPRQDLPSSSEGANSCCLPLKARRQETLSADEDVSTVTFPAANTAFSMAAAGSAFDVLPISPAERRGIVHAVPPDGAVIVGSDYQSAITGDVDCPGERRRRTFPDLFTLRVDRLQGPGRSKHKSIPVRVNCQASRVLVLL
jgi:hypothetical protein